MSEVENIQNQWIAAERPGYQSKRKDADTARWNKVYGIHKWKIGFLTSNGEIWNFDDIFWKIYVPGYIHFFINNPEKADYLAHNFSYAFDKDQISREQAYDPKSQYDKPGIRNQFHDKALNIALEFGLGKPFRGTIPIQVREGKPSTDKSTWPLGWTYTPGHIKCLRPDLIPTGAYILDGSQYKHPSEEIPNPNLVVKWWENNSIEAFYQETKTLFYKK